MFAKHLKSKLFPVVITAATVIIHYLWSLFSNSIFCLLQSRFHTLHERAECYMYHVYKRISYIKELLNILNQNYSHWVLSSPQLPYTAYQHCFPIYFLFIAIAIPYIAWANWVYVYHCYNKISYIKDFF